MTIIENQSIHFKLNHWKTDFSLGIIVLPIGCLSKPNWISQICYKITNSIDIKMSQDSRMYNVIYFCIILLLIQIVSTIRSLDPERLFANIIRSTFSAELAYHQRAAAIQK